MGRSNSQSPGEPARLSAFSLVARAFATIVVISIAVAAYVYQSQRPGVDFVSFWAAGRLMLAGTAPLAYDIVAHRAIELTMVNLGGLMPFPYPPPFLLLTGTFAFLPFWIAYLPWIIGTIALYLFATRPFVAPRFALAHPGALVNAIIGQTGFLTSAIFLGGATLVAKRPVLGGAIIGMLVIKPQLAVLFPVALLGSRNWRAIAAAAASAIALLALAAALLGIETYVAFLSMAQQQGAFLSTREWDWGEQASVFAVFRYFGTGRELAFAVQGVFALAAAALTWRAWASGHPHRAAILAASALFVPPYLFAYDSLILVLPLAVLLKDRDRPWLPAIAWLLLLVPLFGYVGLYEGPNTIPLAAALCLWGLLTLRQAAIQPQVASA